MPPQLAGRRSASEIAVKFPLTLRPPQRPPSPELDETPDPPGERGRSTV